MCVRITMEIHLYNLAIIRCHKLSSKTIIREQMVQPAKKRECNT